MCLNEAKFDSEPTLSYSVGLPCHQSLLQLYTAVSMKQQELVVNRDR